MIYFTRNSDNVLMMAKKIIFSDSVPLNKTFHYQGVKNTNAFAESCMRTYFNWQCPHLSKDNGIKLILHRLHDF